MNYPKTKKYFDGSHYIGISLESQPLKSERTFIGGTTKTFTKSSDIYLELRNTTKKSILPRIIPDICFFSFKKR